jgi:hypothetical protein
MRSTQSHERQTTLGPDCEFAVGFTPPAQRLLLDAELPAAVATVNPPHTEELGHTLSPRTWCATGPIAGRGVVT